MFTLLPHFKNVYMKDRRWSVVTTHSNLKYTVVVDGILSVYLLTCENYHTEGIHVYTS